MKVKITAFFLVTALLGLLFVSPVAAGQTGQDSGPLQFSDLEDRLRQNNLNILILEENISSVEVLDYEEMYDDIRDSLNALGKLHSMLDRGQNSFIASTMLENLEALDDTLDDLRSGEIQKDNDDIVRQLKNAQEQIIMVAQSLYITLKELEVNDASLQDSLNTLDRSIQEMELSHELGQLSALTLDQLYTSRIP